MKEINRPFYSNNIRGDVNTVIRWYNYCLQYINDEVMYEFAFRMWQSSKTVLAIELENLEKRQNERSDSYS